MQLRLLIGKLSKQTSGAAHVSVFNIWKACTYQDMLARKVQQGCPLPESEGSHVPICCPVDGEDSAQPDPPIPYRNMSLDRGLGRSCFPVIKQQELC